MKLRNLLLCIIFLNITGCGKNEITGDVFAANEAIKGGTVYLCRNEIYDKVSNEYKSKFQEDTDKLEFYYRWGLTTRYSYFYLLTMTESNKNSGQACELQANTDVNGKFKFSNISSDNYFLVAYTEIDGRYYTGIKAIDKDKEIRLTLEGLYIDR
jgi:hypothetical protein